MIALRLTGSVRRRARAAGPPAPRRPRFSRAAQPLPPASASPLPPPAAEPLEPRRLLATFTVTTTADDGPGSLRQAILDANVAPGGDAIHFVIAGDAGAVQTIRPLSALPDVTGPTMLDATTQPGYAGTPRVELDGSSAGDDVDGLTLFEAATTVRGLAINSFDGNGIVTRPAAAPVAAWVRIDASYVGTDPAGTVARPNGGAGVLALAPRTALGFGNVISGNRGAGVVLRIPANNPARPTDLNVSDSRIGTDRSGMNAIPNGHEGVLVDGSAAGDDPPARVWLNRNLISGNAFSGVRVDQVRGRGVRVSVSANMIGTDVAGAAALPNGASAASVFRDGVTITGSSSAVVLSGNQISGNAGNGVAVIESLASLQANTIGTDGARARAIGNAGHGVLFLSAGQAEVASNLISGNGGDGVRLTSSEQIRVLANTIGANGLVTAAIPNAGNGVTIDASRSVRVGAFSVQNPGTWLPTPPQAYNRVVGNAGHGIAVFGEPGGDDPFPRQPPSDIVIRGNHIGFAEVNPFGGPLRAAAIPNGGSGVYVAGANGVVVGPDGDDRVANIIAHNAGDGVTVTTRGGVPALGTRVVGNSIFNNGGLGIDLADDGVTPNDPRDPDAGPNFLQNFPVITRVQRNDLDARVTVRLQSVPNRVYRLELFASPTPDRSGHGEGKRLLNVAAGVTTDSAGVATYTFPFRAPTFPLAEWLTATATDSGASTSEFSPAVHSLRGRPFYRPRALVAPPTREVVAPAAAPAARAAILQRPPARPSAIAVDAERPLLSA